MRRRETTNAYVASSAGAGGTAGVRRNSNDYQRRMKMEYDNRDRGALFRNDDKDPNNDKDRDYRGTLNCDGVEYWVSAWIKTSKAGKKYLSLSVKSKVEKRAASERKSPAEDFGGDSVPF
jgi:hypothetical protein